MENINLILLKNGLLKSGNANGMIKKALPGALWRAGLSGANYLARRPVASVSNLFNRFRGIQQPFNYGLQRARGNWHVNQANVANAWQNLPGYQRSLIQGASGFLGLPTSGFSGFIGNQAGDLFKYKHGVETGAIKALEGVDKSLSDYQKQFQEMPFMDRLGIAAGVAFDPKAVGQYMGNARTALQQQIDRLR